MQSPTVLSASASVTTSATCVASLANDGQAYWFCSGFEVTGLGASAATAATVTLAGVQGGPLTYFYPVPAGVTVAAAPFTIQFNPPLAGSAPGTDVVLTVQPFGAGNTKASGVIHGFKGQRSLP